MGEIIKHILDTIKDIIEQSSETNTIVKEVIIGSKANGKPKTPCVWLAVDNISNSGRSNEDEIFDIRVLVICLDQSLETQKCLYSTIDIATNIKKLIVKEYQQFNDSIIDIKCDRVVVNDSANSQQGSVTASTAIVEFKIDLQEEC